MINGMNSIYNSLAKISEITFKTYTPKLSSYVTEYLGVPGHMEISVCNEFPIAWVNCWLPLTSGVSSLYTEYEIVKNEDLPIISAGGVSMFSPPLNIDQTSTKSGFLSLSSHIVLANRETSLASKVISTGYLVLCKQNPNYTPTP